MNTRVCGYCRWMAWPDEYCTQHHTEVHHRAGACDLYQPTRVCATCRHYLGGGQCGVSIEEECRDGGFEAWESGDGIAPIGADQTGDAAERP